MMTLQQWLKSTDGGVLSVRSGKLRAVDNALGQYERSKSEADKRELQKALTVWMNDKGMNWMDSIRNQNRAVQTLFEELYDAGPKVDGEALTIVKQEEKAMVDRIFRNQKLVWRESYISKLVAVTKSQKAGVVADKKVVLQAGKAGRDIDTLTPDLGVHFGGPQAGELLDGIIPRHVRREVLSNLVSIMPDFMKELTASMTPFLGLISAGSSAVYSLAKAHTEYWWAEEMKGHIDSQISAGSPVAAMMAIIRILDRNRNADLYSATISSGEFAGKLAGMLLDGGTATNAAVGLSASLAKLLNLVRIITRDVQEKNSANLHMSLNALDVTVFSTSPILGAYFVCCVPTSVLVNQLLDRFGYAGFQQEVEMAVKAHIEPLRLQARLLIKDSRFIIRALQAFPGVVAPTTKGTDEKFVRDFLGGRAKPDLFISAPARDGSDDWLNAFADLARGFRYGRPS